MQSCQEKAETLMTRIRVRVSVCQQKMKTPARLQTGHGRAPLQMCAAIFKKKNNVGEKA